MALFDREEMWGNVTDSVETMFLNRFHYENRMDAMGSFTQSNAYAGS